MPLEPTDCLGLPLQVIGCEACDLFEELWIEPLGEHDLANSERPRAGRTSVVPAIRPEQPSMNDFEDAMGRFAKPDISRHQVRANFDRFNIPPETGRCSV
ncbi:hypothetical protein [Bosea sp. (in: a-proteobacteria)]|uniref:hypothetical protein n=1 Tax=Bosea sp. (in: a-proteobacteria) TaxID=1871050 RepID=UPI003F70BDED